MKQDYKIDGVVYRLERCFEFKQCPHIIKPLGIFCLLRVWEVRRRGVSVGGGTLAAAKRSGSPSSTRRVMLIADMTKKGDNNRSFMNLWQTDQPTDRPNNGDFRGHREVTLPYPVTGSLTQKLLANVNLRMPRSHSMLRIIAHKSTITFITGVPSLQQWLYADEKILVIKHDFEINSNFGKNITKSFQNTQNYFKICFKVYKSFVIFEWFGNDNFELKNNS